MDTKIKRNYETLRTNINYKKSVESINVLSMFLDVKLKKALEI